MGLGCHVTGWCPVSLVAAGQLLSNRPRRQRCAHFAFDVFLRGTGQRELATVEKVQRLLLITHVTLMDVERRFWLTLSVNNGISISYVGIAV